MLVNNRSHSTTPSVSTLIGGSSTTPTAVAAAGVQQPPGTGHHWSHGRRNHKLTLLRLADEALVHGVLNEAIGGGSEHGQLVVLSPLTSDRRLLQADWLRLEGDPLPLSSSIAAAVLEVDGHAVSGFARRDCLAWIARCLVHRYQLHAGTPGASVQLTTAPLTGKPLERDLSTNCLQLLPANF